MAHSRAERIGTIFSRVTAMVRGGAIEEHNLPLWYKVYEAFPPKYEPLYSRPASTKPIIDIFYKEDILRATFHKQRKYIPEIELESEEPSVCQRFLYKYFEYLKEGFSETEAYEKLMTPSDEDSRNEALKSMARTDKFHNKKKDITDESYF
ncbi:mitochondrial ribosomal protein S23 [Augochlora pura]